MILKAIINCLKILLIGQFKTKQFVDPPVQKTATLIKATAINGTDRTEKSLILRPEPWAEQSYGAAFWAGYFDRTAYYIP